MLKKVQKLITEGNTDLSLTDKADVTETDFVDALETSCTGNIVVLLGEPHIGMANVHKKQRRQERDAGWLGGAVT